MYEAVSPVGLLLNLLCEALRTRILCFEYKNQTIYDYTTGIPVQLYFLWSTSGRHRLSLTLYEEQIDASQES